MLVDVVREVEWRRSVKVLRPQDKVVFIPALNLRGLKARDCAEVLCALLLIVDERYEFAQKRLREGLDFLL